MKLFARFLGVLLMVMAQGQAKSIDDIRRALEQASVTQVQEKVYVHTDNTCYFVGDTLWYKAYVVRADNLMPTDMSRILYVELLTPDGILVERQNIIIAPDNYTCGQFVLQDSLYSGYYELRAYTRWMLNFNVREHDYTQQETWLFYNKQMAADYYRIWDGLYSRVLPIYSKPEKPGDYDARRMYQRPKQRLQKPKKEELIVTFFPEGGHLVEGLNSRVAFDVQDQLGQAVDIKGKLISAGQTVKEIATLHMGRGFFSVTPNGRKIHASFTWRGKNYTFDLPKVERSGVVVTVDGCHASLQTHGLNDHSQVAVSILCRGKLKHFAPVIVKEGVITDLELPLDSLTTGVNNLTVFDSDGQVMADRLFFVNNKRDTIAKKIVLSTPITATTTFNPYDSIRVCLQTPAPNTTFSVAVRDTRTDEPTYNDGNVMTDLLLSSELRGFIARPAYYFEKDDEVHRRNLDLLMMVQGWRKYPWQELSDTVRKMHYEPEKTLTVSGNVYKSYAIMDVDQEEVRLWQKGQSKRGYTLTETEPDENGEGGGTELTMETGVIAGSNDELGVNHGGLKREVLVEAEVVMDDGIVAGRQMTKDGGRFVFQIPPFYGATYLNLKAYKEKDSLKKAMISRQDTKVFKEEEYPDFYIKRDMPFPVFTQKYSYYENHAPEWEVTIDEDSLSELSMENDVHQLGNVNVQGRRRGKRAIDWNKPAFVRDAYDLYNDVTDYGLSWGMFDMRQFPLQVAKFLYGNMGRLNRQFNIDGRWEGLTYWRNYKDMSAAVASMNVEGAADLAESLRSVDNRRSPVQIMNNLRLARLMNIRVFSDYEPRNEDSTLVQSLHVADATVDMENFPDDAKQVVYRDRHIYLHGMTEPVMFYQPDYSRQQPAEPTDFRRTLYWNPNARSDEKGLFTTILYNNSKETRIKISAAGVTPDGCLLYYK